ncbi:MAG TPA: glycosyltransferase family 39 protein [Chthonomonadaceae bacterium]|nr:glycosyltransferase family 39 protein [Chthonomonadaceae bacterium]
MQDLVKPFPRPALRLEALVRARWLVPLLTLALAGVLLYRSPWSASNLEIVPDSVEYAVVAQRVATLGRWDLSINGGSYPARYPPWFSVLLAPAYLLAPSEPGAGILVVLAFALAGLLAAYAIGRRLAGEWGGAAAACALMAYIGYNVMAKKIMTDMPATAVGLLGGWLFLRMRAQPMRRDYVLAGLLMGLAVAVRNENVAMLLPFAGLALRPKEGRIGNLLVLLLPTLLVAGATAAYNQAAFGDWHRTGYQFWCPLPYDYRELIFSPHFIRDNLEMLKAKQVLLAVALGLVGIGLLWRQRAPALRPVLIYLALAALPVTLFHLFYFYAAYRFHLLGLALGLILGGAGLATLVPEALKRSSWLLPALLAAASLAVPFVRHPDPVPDRLLAAQAFAQATTKNAVIVTNIDAVYLEPLVLRDTERRIVPMTRGAEYASKCIAPRRIALPPGVTPHYVFGQGSRQLLHYGARNVIPFTAEEAPQQLEAWARQGVPVYLDHRSPVPPDLTAAPLRWAPVREYPWLLRLQAAPEPARQASGRNRP